MDRTAFLSDADVQQMLAWMRERFGTSGGFCHAYTVRRSRKAWRCNSLYNAFNTYEWKRKNWQATKAELDGFRERLRTALQAGDEQATFETCAAILRWGGVWANNGAYLECRRDVLAEELRHMGRVLTADEEPCALTLRRNPADPSTACRMN